MAKNSCYKPFSFSYPIKLVGQANRYSISTSNQKDNSNTIIK